MSLRKLTNNQLANRLSVLLAEIALRVDLPDDAVEFEKRTRRLLNNTPDEIPPEDVSIDIEGIRITNNNVSALYQIADALYFAAGELADGRMMIAGGGVCLTDIDANGYRLHGDVRVKRTTNGAVTIKGEKVAP